MYPATLVRQAKINQSQLSQHDYLTQELTLDLCKGGSSKGRKKDTKINRFTGETLNARLIFNATFAGQTKEVSKNKV